MFKKAIIVTLALCFLLSFALYIFLWLGHRELEKQKQLWIDSGRTLDPLAFASPPVPEDQNAAIVYRELLPTLNAFYQSQDVVFWGDVWSEDANLGATLEKHAEIVRKIEAAAKLPGCDWGVTYDGYATLSIDNLGDHRRFAKFMNAQAVHRYRLGDDEGALDAMKTMIRIANHAAADKMLNDQLTSIAILALALSTYERAYRERESSADMTPFVELLDSIDMAARYRKFIEGEGVFGFARFASIRPNQQRGGMLGLADAMRHDVLDWDQAYFLRSLREIAESASKELSQTLSIAAKNIPSIAPMSRASVPTYGRVRQSFTMVRCQTEMLKTALHLREYKAQHGVYPEPGEIEIPTDPMSGEPIIYEKVDDGFVLRSAYEGEGMKPRAWEWAR